MKSFFNTKRLIYLAIIAVALIILIILLVFPIGSMGEGFHLYSVNEKKFIYCDQPLKNYWITSPFTSGAEPLFTAILVEQTVVFTLVGIVFVVFLVLFMIELKRAGIFNKVFARRPTKTEQLEQRVAELEQQVDKLTKDE